MAQLVELPTSAQVMISHSVSSSPASGFVLTALSLEPASDSVSSSLSDPPQLMLSRSLSLSLSLKNKHWGAWVAQLVKRPPTSAQVMISHSMSSSPMSGSVQTAQSLDPDSDSVCLSVCLSKMNKC